MIPVWLDGVRTLLNPSRLLGSGGEATVLLHRRGKDRLAVKLYHSVSSKQADKIEALMSLRASLPACVVLPQALVFDDSQSRPIGYAMPALPTDVEPVSGLSKRAFCQARGLDKAAVARLLASLVIHLDRIHLGGAIVGDFNDQNIQITARGELHFIDADSFQLSRFRCDVSTEAFLDPELYGPDPARPCVADRGERWFSFQSDRYALAVIAFRSLTGVHPYGGAVDRLPTLPGRARARHSVFRPGVGLTLASRSRIDALGPRLAELFRCTFEGGGRPALSARMLAEFADSLVRCSCGEEFDRVLGSCPSCAPKVAAVTISSSPPVPVQLSCRVLFQARGPIVALLADPIVAVAIENGSPVLYRLVSGILSRSPLLSPESDRGHRIYLSPGSLLIASESQDRAVWHDLVTGQSQEIPVERALGAPALALGSDHLYRTARGQLLRTFRGEESMQTVTETIDGQAELHGGASGVVIVERILGLTRYRYVAERQTLDLEVPPPKEGETLIEEEIRIVTGSLLVLRVTLLAGQRMLRSSLFRVLGDRRMTSLEALCHRETAVAARPATDSISGGILLGSRYLVASERGLVSEDFGSAVAPKIFEAARNHLPAEALLALTGNRKIIAVSGHQLVELELGG